MGSYSGGKWKSLKEKLAERKAKRTSQSGRGGKRTPTDVSERRLFSDGIKKQRVKEKAADQNKPQRQEKVKTTKPSPEKASAKPMRVANPAQAIADFEAKLKAAGVVSIAGGKKGKAQLLGKFPQ